MCPAPPTPFTPEAIAQYVARREKDLRDVQAALAHGDFAFVATIGHRFQGSASSFGFPELGEVGARLEAGAHAADPGATAAAISELEAWLATRSRA